MRVGTVPRAENGSKGMTGFFTAVVVFATIAGIIAALRADDAAIATNGCADELRRMPEPGPRDMHAVTGVLARAHVPSWG